MGPAAAGLGVRLRAGRRRPERRQALPARLPVQARDLLPLRAGGPGQGAARHRTGAAHPLHGRDRPPGGAGPGALVPHVGHAGLCDRHVRTPDRTGGRGQLPRPRRLPGRRGRGQDPLARAVPGRRPGRADRGRLRRHAVARHPDRRRPAGAARARARAVRHRRPPGGLPPHPLHRDDPRPRGVRPAARPARRPVPRDARQLRAPDPGGAGGAGGAGDHAGGLPLHGGQGPHRPAVGHFAVAPGRGRGDRGGRLRAERRGHGPPAREDHAQVPRERDAAEQPRRGLLGRTRPRCRTCWPTCASTTARSSEYAAGIGAGPEVVAALRASLLEPAGPS